MSAKDDFATLHPKVRRVIRWGLLSLGFFTIFLGGCGLSGVYRLSEWTGVVYDAVGMLILQQPGRVPLEGTFFRLYSTARILAVLFASLTALGVFLKISRPARIGWRRMLLWWLRREKDAAVVIGMGWIGGPLAKELREDGRPVTGIEWEEDSPRAVDAWRSGVLVVVGDATDPAVRKRAGLEHASEVFIATGDDARNLEVAGGLLDDARHGRLGDRSETPLLCYVHVGDPAFSAAARSQQLLEQHGAVEFRTFSNRTLAAHDLFLDLCLDLELGLLSPQRSSEDAKVPRPATPPIRPPRTVPSDGEAFHLFVFGFGLTGQAVALHTARFAHFASHRRPRLTLFGDAADGRRPWDTFLSRHPAFAPRCLDLAKADFLGDGESWKARPVRPAAHSFRTADPVPADEEPVSDDEKKAARARVHAVEYAVNAEFDVLEPDLESERVLDALEARLRLERPRPKGALVVCFEEERTSFHAALRLQRALAHRFLNDPPKKATDGNEPPPFQAPFLPLPIYVYLPVEKGLAALLAAREDGRDGQEPAWKNDRLRREVDRHFPLCAFGQQSDVTSYGAITRGHIRGHAGALDSLHSLLSGRRGAHPDFEDSTVDAVLFAELKFDALGIRFSKRKLSEEEAEAGGLSPSPLLEVLFHSDVDEEYRKFEQHVKAGKGVQRLSPGELLAAFEKRSQELRERVALLGLIELPPEEEWGEAAAQWEELKTALREATAEAVARFAREVEDAGRDPHVAGAMEHNRWMGERLSKGWRFGPRSEMRRQRLSFVPYDELSDDDKSYDLQQLARLIAAKREGPSEDGLYAYIAPDTGSAVPGAVKHP